MAAHHLYLSILFVVGGVCVVVVVGGVCVFLFIFGLLFVLMGLKENERNSGKVGKMCQPNSHAGT